MGRALAEALVEFLLKFFCTVNRGLCKSISKRLLITVVWDECAWRRSEFGQPKKSIDYILSSSKSNGLHKKSPCLPVPDINFKIAVTRITKVYN